MHGIRGTAVLLLLALSGGAARVVAQDAPPTNLAVLQALTARAGSAMMETLRGTDSVVVSVALHPDDKSWILLPPILEAGRSAHLRTVRTNPRYTIECTLAGSSIVYEDPRTSGFLGARIVDRVVRVSIAGVVTDAVSGAVLYAGTQNLAARDTVAMAAIPRLEEAGLRITQGEMPEEGFFTWLLEPLIMVGAVAVSIYLLFHVRS